ncbi:MAG TPA: helix-hairpin-helix domain-containing protein [Myxococcota bacterium]|nr:helix-hairpin-helix domain-containing protein [Myxococcota bacterium]
MAKKADVIRHIKLRMETLLERQGYTAVARLASRVFLFFLLFAWPGVSLANDYGGFIQVESDEDLLDLLSAQEIDDQDYEALRELLEDGVDLNTADRDEIYALPNLTYADVDAILAYRDDAGSISDPLALVTASVISQRKLEAIAPFLLVVEREPALFATRGRFRYLTTWVAGDRDVPSMVLSGKVSTLKNLDIELTGVITRNRIADVVYDPNRDALSARPASVQLHVPKFYLQWEEKKWHLLAGTYRIGFGQRLTFDNTTWYAPNGIRADDTISYNQDLSRTCKESAAEQGESPCAGADASAYESPDYRWTDRLRGLAVGLRNIETGTGWMQAYGFFSYQTRSIYQYEIYDRGRCADPLDDSDPDCAAPWVYRRRADLLDPTSRFSFQTLPDMYNELLGGGNFSYFFNRRSHLGVTGYGASVSWLTQGLDLDFQEWSRLPYGGPFGAVGVDGAWGVGMLDLFFEAARSFDGQPAGGGYGAIARATLTLRKHEFEGTVRYYDKNFANPYARPVSAADEYDGLRARDEAGMRLRYTGQLGDLQLRSLLDFWAQLSDRAPKMRLRVRADYELERWLIPGLWAEYQDKDLATTGRENCFEVPFGQVEGEPVPCAGEKVQLGVQARLLPFRNLSLTLKYQHRFLDDGRASFADSMRQDMALWLVVMYRPTDAIRLRARLRYLNEAISEGDYLEQSVWFYLEAAYRYAKDFRVKLRYELYAWIDDRSSTVARDPNPAHWLRLELEYRF